MKKPQTLLVALLLCVPVAALAAPLPPIRVILVGDSTMASGSGYGDALCARFSAEVTCVNLARGGRSSGSVRAEGSWDKVQGMLGSKGQFSATYVLVQFGHNDQPGKPGRSTDLVTEFPVNTARYVTETKVLGGVPVLVTPLTRRSFKGEQLRNELSAWADATRKVAVEEHAALLDLNADSVAAVQAMGQAQADTLAMAPPPAKDAAPPTDPGKMEPAGAAKSAFDRTHLGEKGATYFSAMVAREMAAALPAVAPYLKKE